MTRAKPDRQKNHTRRQQQRSQRRSDETPFNKHPSSAPRRRQTNTSRRTNNQNAQHSRNNRNTNHTKETPQPNNNTRTTRNVRPQQRRYQPTETEYANTGFRYPITYAEVTKASLPQQQPETSNNNLSNNRMQNHFLNPPSAHNHVLPIINNLIRHPMMYQHLHGQNNNQFRLPSEPYLPSNQR